ncbi:unnamed protein product [Rangifer tarandus platyrhynchus]|uniref:Uncharacterized protein n=1 Tax=Rangifer tarandus platyrhynchus TaxID=3082113 RepID=A0AC59YXB7_RANTA
MEGESGRGKSKKEGQEADRKRPPRSFLSKDDWPNRKSGSRGHLGGRQFRKEMR